MQFEIHAGEHVKVCKLQDLSRSILLNSEVYIVEGKEKRLIGISSGKTIAYLSVEFADYALNNYTNLGGSHALPAKNCIHLVRKWIEDSSSVSQEELGAAAANAAWAAEAAAEAARAARAAAVASSSAIKSDKDARIKAEKHEFERQGIFILDFFKTEKNMFLM